MARRSQEHLSAFADLVEARSTTLLRLAYVVVGDYQLAQDLLQEALIKAYVAWPRLRDTSNAEAYLRRTMVTTAISWRRRCRSVVRLTPGQLRLHQRGISRDRDGRYGAR
jgi:DNA-directed RNA polymerase specialized sigma24 family protein